MGIKSKVMLVKLVLPLSLAALFLLAVPVEASATSSTVGAVLCDSTSAPELTVTSPESDSVVNSPTIQLKGTTVRTSQIDVLLNGAYSSSIGIGQSEQFDTTLTLPQGTNTIELNAFFSCNQTSSTTTLIVTYEPAAAPSTGSETNTSVPPAATTRPPTRSFGNQAPEPRPKGGPAKPSIIDKIKDNLGIGNPLPDSNMPESSDDPDASASFGWLIAALAAIGLFAPFVMLFVLDNLGGAIGINSRQYSTAVRWSIRLSGVVVALLVSIVLRIYLGT